MPHFGTLRPGCVVKTFVFFAIFAILQHALQHSKRHLWQLASLKPVITKSAAGHILACSWVIYTLLSALF